MKPPAQALRMRVAGVGVLGPGLADWTTGAPLLRRPGDWTPQPTAVPTPPRLPATERRRAGTLVKASIAVADQALSGSGLDATALATVFTSSTGDPTNCHLLCEALAQRVRLVSPTRFTNSVHNAPSGYWHIASGSRWPSTSLAAHDASFAAGLLEAGSQCRATRRPVLLVACDVPYPEPLHALRPLADSFAVALVLAPSDRADDTGPELALDLTLEAAATPCSDLRLDAVRRTNPAARALPLLMALARAEAADLVLEAWPGMALRVRVEQQDAPRRAQAQQPARQPQQPQQPHQPRQSQQPQQSQQSQEPQQPPELRQPQVRP